MVLNTYSSELIKAAVSNTHVVQGSTSITKEKIDNSKKADTSEVKDLSSEVFERNNLRNVRVNCIEDKISAYQEYDKVLDDDYNALLETKKSFENFKKLDNVSSKDVDAVTISLKHTVEKIDDNSKKMTSSSKEVISSSLGRIFDSNDFDKIDSNYRISDVIVGGESYMANRSFDISTAAGSSAALSVIEGAITKITNVRQEIQKNINELMHYPEILELDRVTYLGEQSKIRSANTAQILVNKLKSAVRLQINEVQNSQKVEKISDVISLLTEV